MVKLHKDSKKYLDLLDNYHWKDFNFMQGKFYEPPVLLDICLVADTRDLKTGELKGFPDCLLFDLTVYYPYNMTKFELCNRDKITIELPSNVIVFKNQLVTIRIDQPCLISNTQQVYIFPLEV